MLQRPPAVRPGSCRNRLRLAHLLVAAILLLSLDVRAREWWEKIPYMQWPRAGVYELLTASPWVGLSPAGFRQGQRPVSTDGIRVTGYPIRCFYMVRLVTAQPIREAMLRSISLQGKLVSIRNGRMSPESERDRLKAFMASRPNDLRIKGDHRRIIIAVTLRIHDRSSLREEDSGPELSDVDIARLGEETSLATDAGRRAGLADYTPAGDDRMGVKFYFPRNLPDGSPLIDADDRELIFKTRLNGNSIKVKFNLKEMLCHGKLET